MVGPQWTECRKALKTDDHRVDDVVGGESSMDRMPKGTEDVLSYVQISDFCHAGPQWIECRKALKTSSELDSIYFVS